MGRGSGAGGGGGGFGRPLGGGLGFGFGLAWLVLPGRLGDAGAAAAGRDTKAIASARPAGAGARRFDLASDRPLRFFRATGTVSCVWSGCRLASELNGAAGNGNRTAGGVATRTFSGTRASRAERQR